MAKLLLSNAAMVEEYFEGTALIGIVSAQPAYRICWLINNHFDVDFVRDPEQNILLQKKDKQKNEIRYNFPIYQYNIPNSCYKYVLYKLKNGPESLLPDQKQMDYLWLVQTADPENDAKLIFSELKNIPDIQLALILDMESIKNLDNLLV